MSPKSCDSAELLLSLSQLRKRSGRSQAEVASTIGTTQSGISRIERQDDLLVSTLVDYITALGGQLRLVVDSQDGCDEIALPALKYTGPSIEQREFRVIWQDQQTRALVHVGWLLFTGDGFEFSYTDEAKTNDAFTPFAPFPLLDDTYCAPSLFPFFAVRLTTAADPGFTALLDALGLERAEATPTELLARSPGDSAHDTIQVVPEPVEGPDGTLVRTFLVSGVRHADENDPESVGRLVQQLAVGAPLELLPEPTNPLNPRALQLVVDGKVVGWVPDHLVDEVHAHLEARRDISFDVERSNGPSAPWHLRLLCRMSVSEPKSE